MPRACIRQDGPPVLDELVSLPRSRLVQHLGGGHDTVQTHHSSSSSSQLSSSSSRGSPLMVHSRRQEMPENFPGAPFGILTITKVAAQRCLTRVPTVRRRSASTPTPLRSRLMRNRPTVPAPGGLLTAVRRRTAHRRGLATSAATSKRRASPASEALRDTSPQFRRQRGAGCR